VTGRYIPMHLWKLVDDLWQRGLDEEELFNKNGDFRQLQEVIFALDNTEHIDQLEELPGSVATVAECLLLFVNSLPSPVIPVSHYELCVEHFNNEPIRKKIISSLNPQAQTLFEYLVAFLREIVKHSDLNGTNTDFLARLFSNAILRPDKNLKKETDGAKREYERQKVCLFLREFIRPREAQVM